MHLQALFACEQRSKNGLQIEVRTMFGRTKTEDAQVMLTPRRS